MDKLSERTGDAGGPRFLIQVSALADATRCRLLLVLGEHELTVAEICQVLQLPQSTASRHLKTLADGGWVRSRRDGTSRLYRVGPDELGEPARSLWGLAREALAHSVTAEQDSRRLEQLVAQRRERTGQFFAGAAGRWDRMRDELFGPGLDSTALCGLLDDTETVADLGCGTGPVAAALAPFVRRVIAIDGSPAMLEAAGRRLGRFDNVELRRGELESLPIEDGSVDTATLVLVLHHLSSPGRVLDEVRRILRPTGKLLVVDMLPHDRHEYREQMGHVFLGFSEDHLRSLLAAAGLVAARVRPLPVDPSAQGPGLFVATARPAAARLTKLEPRAEGARHGKGGTR